MIVKLCINDCLIHALPHLILQAFILCELDVLHQNIFQVDVTNILREKCIQFLENFIQVSAKSVIYFLLQLFVISYRRSDLCQLDIEHLIINAVRFEYLKFLIEIFLERIHNFTRYDRVHLGLNTLDEWQGYFSICIWFLQLK